jgi:hypothetical protein
MEKEKLFAMKASLDHISNEIELLTVVSKSLSLEDARKICDRIFQGLMQFDFSDTKSRDANFKIVDKWFENLKKLNDPATNYLVFKTIADALQKNVVLLKNENNLNS